jgi:hypothetical protein
MAFMVAPGDGGLILAATAVISLSQIKFHADLWRRKFFDLDQQNGNSRGERLHRCSRWA